MILVALGTFLIGCLTGWSAYAILVHLPYTAQVRAELQQHINESHPACSFDNELLFCLKRGDSSLLLPPGSYLPFDWQRAKKEIEETMPGMGQTE